MKKLVEDPRIVNELGHAFADLIGTPDAVPVVAQGSIFPKMQGYGMRVDTKSPTFGWRDLEGQIIPKTSGVGSPTLANFRGAIRGYSYAAGEDGDCVYHIPHDYLPGSDLFLHLHWAHNGTAISGSLTVDLAVTYAKGHNQANFPAPVSAQITYNTVNIATTPQYRHRIDEIQISAKSPSAAQFDTDDIEVDGIILVNFDVAAIPTITGGSPNEPFLFYLDLHYQSTNMPTKQKAPDFYV